jgi:hypothetical protein
MNDDTPKSIWKKSRKGPRGFMLAFMLLAFSVFIIVACFQIVFNRFSGFHDIFDFTLYDLVISTFIAIVGILIVKFIQWLCCWRNFKRFLFGLACFITLIALFYAEEDWRGKHDWDKFKRQWEAKGERFDWQSIVPPPVPDDQNFAFSPVWIAQEKYTFQKTPKRAEAWYGNRIYNKEVSRFFLLLPVTTTAVVATNFWDLNLPETPDSSGNWQTARLSNLKPWQTYYRDLEKTNPAANISITPQPQSPAQDVLLALSKFDPVIEQLRTDSARPDSRFPLGYDDADKAAILLPHLAAIKQIAQVLQLRAIAELQNNESDKALDDVKLMLRLINSVHTEPFLISHLVRIAILLESTLQPIYEGLANHQWSDAQLTELDAELAKLDFLADYETAMRGELGLQTANIDYLIQHRRDLFNFFNDFPGNSHPSGPPFIGSLIPTGWFYQNRLNCARMMVKYYIPLADVTQQTVSPAAARRADEALRAQTKSATPCNFFEKMLFPFFGHAVQKFAYAQSAVDLARVAVALERYRLAHGDYPESLDALTPQFMKEIPHDIIGGQPLHYRRTAEGQFVLYSVGWNETDDGGVVALAKDGAVDTSKGDWVWRYPSKAE